MTKKQSQNPNQKQRQKPNQVQKTITKITGGKHEKEH
jgi:hypothetical protein